MQPRQFAVIAMRAGRVVRVGHKNHTRLVRDQRQQRINVRAIVLVRGNNNIGRRLARRNVVNRKAIADIYDVIASTRITQRDQVQQLV